MTHQRKLDDLARQYNLTDDEYAQLMGVVRIEHCKKGSLFLRYGEHCSKVAILIEGYLYAYTWSEEGERKISQFFHLPDDFVIINYDSYNNYRTSDEAIECFTDAVLLIFERSDVEKLTAQNPKFLLIRKLIAENLLIKARKYIKLLQTANAHERLRELQRQAPELFQQFPHSYLAAYLGMHRNTYNKALQQL